MEWTAERNPDREYNFRIRELGAGRFAVVSDSERFGADQVVFESFRRGECVDYVTQRRDPGKWNYYVIEDLSSWIRGSENPSPLERFDRFDQAKQRFCELRDRQENDDITDKPHLTMGVGWVGGLDLDVLHVRRGKNVRCAGDDRKDREGNRRRRGADLSAESRKPDEIDGYSAALMEKSVFPFRAFADCGQAQSQT